MFTTTAFDIWKSEQHTPHLITLCSELDTYLGGGIEIGKITEFCGGPGTGKTQICQQICLTVQFPSECGGIFGKAVFIDTNQDFSPHRLHEIAGQISRRFERHLRHKTPAATFDKNSLLQNVSYMYCQNFKQVLAYLLLLPNILKSDRKIKLIVMDSFSNLIRKICGVSERTRISYKILTEFHKIADKFQIAVVITNELTTHFTRRKWIVRPTLGSIHAHKINRRIILSKFNHRNNYCAFVAKSATSKKANAFFQISANGIRSMQ